MNTPKNVVEYIYPLALPD